MDKQNESSEEESSFSLQSKEILIFNFKLSNIEMIETLNNELMKVIDQLINKKNQGVQLLIEMIKIPEKQTRIPQLINYQFLKQLILQQKLNQCNYESRDRIAYKQALENKIQLDKLQINEINLKNQIVSLENAVQTSEHLIDEIQLSGKLDDKINASKLFDETNSNAETKDEFEVNYEKLTVKLYDAMNKKLNPINQLIQQDQLESAKLAFIYTKFTKLIQDYILQNETLTQKKFDFQNKSKQSVQQIKKQEQEIKLLSETLKKCQEEKNQIIMNYDLQIKTLSDQLVQSQKKK